MKTSFIKSLSCMLFLVAIISSAFAEPTVPPTPPVAVTAKAKTPYVVARFDLPAFLRTEADIGFAHSLEVYLKDHPEYRIVSITPIAATAGAGGETTSVIVVFNASKQGD